MRISFSGEVENALVDHQGIDNLHEFSILSDDEAVNL